MNDGKREENKNVRIEQDQKINTFIEWCVRCLFKWKNIYKFFSPLVYYSVFVYFLTAAKHEYLPFNSNVYFSFGFFIKCSIVILWSKHKTSNAHTLNENRQERWKNAGFSWQCWKYDNRFLFGLYLIFVSFIQWMNKNFILKDLNFVYDRCVCNLRTITDEIE